MLNERICLRYVQAPLLKGKPLARSLLAEMTRTQQAPDEYRDFLTKG